MKSIISSRISFLFYFGVNIFLPFAAISASYGRNETDREALLLFKSMITHDPYGAVSSWNTSFPFCDWNGVTCGKRHIRVTALKLSSQGLEGSLSPHVGNLSFLRELWLDNNTFQGSIPHELGRLSRLRSLDLTQNKFNGTIPTNLSGCSNLEEIFLSSNMLAGSIPNEISLNTKLTLVSLQDNDLTGGIPPFLGNLTSLRAISLMGNPLGGRIPDTLGHLDSLQIFYTGDCNLSGTIPHSFYNLSLLTGLSLSGNELTGSLPREFGAMLPNLDHLQLRDNQLTGVLPTSISNCSRLERLELKNNFFSGNLTIDFSNLRHITDILLDRNLFGSEEYGGMEFIDSLKNCSKLVSLSLYGCNLHGVLPRSIGNLSDQLTYLDFGKNKLSGNLPSSIGNLVALTFLNFEVNQFTGRIPFEIGKLQKLQIVGLMNNKFSGPIPYSIGNLSLLNSLYLFSNRLEGRIPSSLGNCQKLNTLDLNDNKLVGEIPKEIVQLRSLSVKLDLSRNQLYGSVPNEVGELRVLTYLDLSHNELSGDIPSSLGGCTSLTWLFFGSNLFEGMLPQSLSSLRGLIKLNLSHNNLSGKIPRFLELFQLENIDLSYNDFDGEVPVKGVFANASAFSVFENDRLCGGLTELGLPKCKETEKHNKRFPLFLIIILIASALCTVSCLVYVCCKKKKKGQPTQSSRSRRFVQVSYNQLLKATDGFSKANLIGTGGVSDVYKAILDNNDSFVAVKVLHLQSRGAHKSFVRECEAWRNIRHRNLLKVITSCSSVDFQGNDFKALVYEFMPKGSLHDWLHSNANTSRLNLLQRINILMDVACALDYLHNRCETTIIHGDLKPSNILLDDDMVAHVGDFGLARFLGTTSNQNSSTGIKGTIGYAPPEYGLGSEMTSSGDVYSYGILLLEVMTGKKPTEDIFNEGLSLHKYAYMAFPDHVIDIIDGDAIVLQSTKANANKMEECLTATMKIGVLCSVESSPQRMKIENVVNELQHILAVFQNI